MCIRDRLTDNAAVAILKYAVAEAMSGGVRTKAASGLKSWGPEAAIDLITNIKRLAAVIADRVIAPRR